MLAFVPSDPSNPKRHRRITFSNFSRIVRDAGFSLGSYADFGWFLPLKLVSDPCQSTNRKRTCEIYSFRTISCGIGKELSFWQSRTGGFLMLF